MNSRTAPLTLSQRAHWNQYRLMEKPAIRQIVSANRLFGYLHIHALERSIKETVNRHDSLRTRIISVGGVPIQKTMAGDDFDVRVDDLSLYTGVSRDEEILRIIDEMEMSPINVSVDPLFGIRLLKICNKEHVLVVAMEHMISDAWSMQIFLRDMFATYTRMMNGGEANLPVIPLQFPEYAHSQQRLLVSRTARYGEHWMSLMSEHRRPRFPDEPDWDATGRVGVSIALVRIAKPLKDQLRKWCVSMRTTLALCLLTAYVALVLRWCDIPDGVVQFQSDGRVEPEVENTMGYFSFILYLSVSLFPEDTFVDLLERTTNKYCDAYIRSDYGYISAQVPRPEVTRNTVFNFVPQGARLDMSGLISSQHALRWEEVPFVHPMLSKLELDQEPGILLYDSDDEVQGYVHFPANRFSISSMQRFVQSFVLLLEAQVSQSERRVTSVVLRKA